MNIIKHLFELASHWVQISFTLYPLALPTTCLITNTNHAPKSPAFFSYQSPVIGISVDNSSIVINRSTAVMHIGGNSSTVIPTVYNDLIHTN